MERSSRRSHLYGTETTALSGRRMRTHFTAGCTRPKPKEPPFPWMTLADLQARAQHIQQLEAASLPVWKRARSLLTNRVETSWRTLFSS